MTEPEPTEPSIWLAHDPEAAVKYPNYAETARRLEEVLDSAQVAGVSIAEITSMLATLHARALARLHPNEAQRERVIDVFRQTVIACQDDLGGVPPMTDEEDG